ncbi:unnamed protein product [Lactuca saligna]|uniref:Uncharacterized protein n=1 Tax=Lactuca saligna TaxID=75948 RepID=A0AA35YNL3_LACSI|nr:unnamed protein product [Lactuca saligna]
MFSLQPRSRSPTTQMFFSLNWMIDALEVHICRYRHLPPQSLPWHHYSSDEPHKKKGILVSQPSSASSLFSISLNCDFFVFVMLFQLIRLPDNGNTDQIAYVNSSFSGCYKIHKTISSHGYCLKGVGIGRSEIYIHFRHIICRHQNFYLLLQIYHSLFG